MLFLWKCAVVHGFKFKHIFKVCMNNLNVAVIIIIIDSIRRIQDRFAGVSARHPCKSILGGRPMQRRSEMPRNHILANWRKKFYGVYPVCTIIQHPAKRSYRHQARQAILTIWRKKFYGVYPVRTIVRHPAKRSEMPRNHILVNWRKKVLWSLPCLYDNPTPSEAILPPPSSAGYFDDMKKKVLWSLPCPYDSPTPSEAVWNVKKSYFGEVKKKVLWSLPCPYDSPTPSEAVWNAKKSNFDKLKKKVLWSLPCPYDNPTPSEAVWNAKESYFGELKKKVLWSLPCPYDSPTPSEAILPHNVLALCCFCENVPLCTDSSSSTYSR